MGTFGRPLMDADVARLLAPCQWRPETGRFRRSNEPNDWFGTSVTCMRFRTSRISGLIEFIPAPHVDERGFFSRTFDVDIAREAGVDALRFVQDSLSRSRKGVLRGLHLRTGRGEGKLVRCSFGRVYDVVVDLRPGSVTYGEWLAFELDGDTQHSLFIPAGCAHGFQALTKVADTFYRIDRPHDPSEDLNIAHDDPQLAIAWPLPVSAMSRADATAPPISELAAALRQVEAQP